MKFGLYPRLAMAGIRKNKRLYVPYLLTCTGMVMMYYIIVFLQHNAMLENMRGDETVSTILGCAAEKRNSVSIISLAWAAATWCASKFGKPFL